MEKVQRKSRFNVFLGCEFRKAEKRSSLLFSTKAITTVPESGRNSQESTSPPPFLLLEKWISSLFCRISVSILGRLEIRTRWGQISVSICGLNGQRSPAGPTGNVSLPHGDGCLYLHQTGHHQLNGPGFHSDVALSSQIHFVFPFFQNVRRHWQ